MGTMPKSVRYRTVAQVLLAGDDDIRRAGLVATCRHVASWTRYRLSSDPAPRCISWLLCARAIFLDCGGNI
jgi:hypothetical protein